jgi:hypothetical protein
MKDSMVKGYQTQPPRKDSTKVKDNVTSEKGASNIPKVKGGKMEHEHFHDAMASKLGC